MCRSFQLRLPFRLSRLECLVVIAIVIVLIGLLMPNPHVQQMWELQNRMADWKAGPDIGIAESNLLSNDGDLSGEWLRGSPRARCTIKLSAASVPDTYQVVCHSRFGEWQTTALRTGSRLTLAHPVAENPDMIFETLWIIHVDGVDYLIPMTRTDDFNKARKVDDALELWRYYGFRREVP